MKNRYKFRLLAPSLLGLLAVGTAHTARGQCFQSAQHYAVGQRPRAVAVRDFNADGKPDLAVANQNGGNVSVLLGTGNPANPFGPAQNYGVGNDPHSVAVGDFNKDGAPDLAVANASDGTVSVLLGNGDGTFQAARNFGVAGGPESVAVGDFNKDGLPDLATANSTGDNVSVLLNTDAADLFEDAKSFGVGDNTNPVSVAVGDFNKDGKPDLATANNENNTVSVLLNTGNANLFGDAKNFAVGGQPFSVAVGDFNKDGKPDLATANAVQFSGNASVLLNTGNLANLFGPSQNYGVGAVASSVAVSDFNQDGKPDLATANAFSDDVSVLPGNGDGTFQAAKNFGGLNEPISVAVGDFNSDRLPDLAVTNGDNNTVSVLLSIPPGPLSFGVSLGGGLTCVGQPLNLTLTPSCPDTGPYTAQLSNAHGSFNNPRNLGVVQAGANALPLPAGLAAGTGYRVRLLYGGGQLTAPSAPFTVSAPAFSVAGVAPSVGGVPVCRGGQVTVSFSVPSGSCPLPEGRTEAQLSSSHGSFGNPTSLGLVEPNVANLVTIPAGVAAGTGYRIRLVHAGQASAYSRVFQVKACPSRMSAEEAHLVVVPNPVAGGEVRCRVSGMDDPSFSLTTSAGRGVGISVKTDGSGEFVLTPKQRLVAGVYVVQATEGTTRLTTRVLVVE